MKETTDANDKMAIHQALEAYRSGRLSRRTMIKTLAAAGVGIGGARFFGRETSAHPALLPMLQEATPPADVTAYLKDVGGKFKGTTIKVVSEDTPPSKAINTLAQKEFYGATGITVQWELIPLDQVLSKVSVDAAGQLGANDIYYFDQAWVGRFINDTFDPRELLKQKPDLVFPNYNIDDFLKPLTDHIASYGGKQIGFPCDVPIFIYMYRKDVYDQLQLKPATTMVEYMANAKAINDVLSGKGTYGTVGQMKSGHYSLECDMTAWVWSHGGSIFGADKKCSLNDDKSIAGLDYMLQLQKYMPSGVTTWDWGGQSDAISAGQGGQVITWGEDFPGFDDPSKSKVSGLMHVAPLPKPIELRPAEQAGFEETPNLGHQGGSTYCLSKYSKNADAAWVFLQWATSSDIQTRASLLGGGASPMRQSTFDDPRVAAAKKVGAGTTRHFDVMLDVIKNYMGTEPHLPQWPSIATDVIAVELGKLTTGGYGSTKEAADAIKKKVDDAASQ